MLQYIKEKHTHLTYLVFSLPRIPILQNDVLKYKWNIWMNDFGSEMELLFERLKKSLHRKQKGTGKYFIDGSKD